MVVDTTETMVYPAVFTAARLMELTVSTRMTIEPWLMPLDSATASARNFSCSSARTAISTQVLVDPMSRPTRYLSFFDKRRSHLAFTYFCAPSFARHNRLSPDSKQLAGNTANPPTEHIRHWIATAQNFPPASGIFR